MLCFTGLGVEGIFRVNGNARIVEKLKTSFDLHGDANLDEDNDILAVAGVLKQFLREMPDSVVPEHMTRQFVNVQEGRWKYLGQHTSFWYLTVKCKISNTSISVLK